MEFNIHVGNNDPKPAVCQIQLQAPEGVNPATWSWYDKPCDGSDYHVSWGYVKSSDAAIMTLVRYVGLLYLISINVKALLTHLPKTHDSPAKDAQAFFGFDNISTSENLGSSGPNPVESRDPKYEL